ncbi:MAG: precorrin-6y C5,15-methyltransferase (decarboxylating) subunit CbiE [Desulfovibrio sp.]|nr:precorrin-6y C5,15-methyltransferase (decarboxylating) subunit CbiE [Desulfovibrio sp.]
MNSTAPNVLTVLGLALDFAEQGLAPDAYTLLTHCDLICGFPATLAALQKQNPDLAARQRFFSLTLPLEPCFADLEARRAQGQRIVLVAGGDPLFYGLGSTLTRYFSPEKLQILPQLSALQLACARLGQPLHELEVLSLHGRDAWQQLDCALLGQKSLGVLLDAQHPIASVARHLWQKGCRNYQFHIFSNLGHADEGYAHLSVESAQNFATHGAVTLILKRQDLAPRPHLGLEEDALCATTGYTTSLAVRATALALLAIEPSDVFWDIGSGSGQVALEAASLTLRGAVYAVEEKQDRACAIEQRAQRLGACNLQVIQGLAPTCLTTLPDPQRIFVGGGLHGKTAQKLLDCLCQRLLPGGRLLISCVLFSSFERALNTFQDLRWPLRILQVQASEARPLAQNLHFQAENPVFLLCAERPFEEV